MVRIEPCGVYQTNCYIITLDDKDIIIDPGEGALNFIKKNVTNPIAILNTHGHFDHIWSNDAVKKHFNIPLYTPKGDLFMLKESSKFGFEVPPSIADFSVKPDETVTIDDVKIKFHHYPGHTPGCSAIEISDSFFSGDFVFKNSIGRTDFPFSNPQDMQNSIRKFLKLDYNKRLYPGHGSSSDIKTEQKNITYWLT
jgi:glyoxylase-like metal-dependent hydrolase (beta-lactamase superfamily II)